MSHDPHADDVPGHAGAVAHHDDRPITATTTATTTTPTPTRRPSVRSTGAAWGAGIARASLIGVVIAFCFALATALPA